MLGRYWSGPKTKYWFTVFFEVPS